MTASEPVADLWVDSLCDDLHGRRPSWVTGGSLSRQGTRFLGRALVDSGAATAVEIGAASGFSTAVLAAVLVERRRRGQIEGPVRVASFDASERWYVDPSRRTGEAAVEMGADLIDIITFNVPATAAKLHDFFERDSIKFLFIDANHSHPWPTLDLMMALPLLAPGATVVFDDINLPIINAKFPAWGAHHVFYGMRVHKTEGAPYRDGTPTMGSVSIPVDKGGVAEQLLDIVESESWEVKIPESYVENARRRARSAL